MTEITVTRGEFPGLFGGYGFHNAEAAFYRLMEKEQFDQKVCKCYREISPGFCRTFGGYHNWTEEHMKTFAEYYEKMQKWTETPIYLACAKGQLHFSDEERRDYCEKVAEKLDFLINELGVRQIRYYCYSNELSMNDWGGLLKDLPLFQKYHEYLYDAFCRRDLNIGLLATDASGGHWDTLDYAIRNMNRITEDFCLHDYMDNHLYQPGSPDLYPEFFRQCREAVMKCIRCDGKRLILGELGVRRALPDEEGVLRQTCFVHLPGVIKDVTDFNYQQEGALGALMYAEAGLAAINAGVFAVVNWTFTDYPDPYVCHYAEKDPYAREWGKLERFVSQTQDVKYNKCGLIRWEEDGDYSVRESYYCLGLLAKYCKRNSRLLDIDSGDELLRITGLQNRDGSVSLLVINRHPEICPLKVHLKLKHPQKRAFRVYEFDSRNVPMNEFGDLQDPSALLEGENGELAWDLLPDSLTVFTTDWKEYPEIYAENVRREGDLLCWDPVEEENHCYYRVYRGTFPDFIPGRENQIASTVAETLDFSARYMEDAAILRTPGEYYKVRSIGK